MSQVQPALFDLDLHSNDRFRSNYSIRCKTEMIKVNLPSHFQDIKKVLEYLEHKNVAVITSPNNIIIWCPLDMTNDVYSFLRSNGLLAV